MTADDVAPGGGATRAHHIRGPSRGSDALPPIGEEYAPVEKDPTGRYLRYPTLLGRGACKQVFKAFDTHTGAEVAWNQVQLAGAELDPAALEYLFREIRLLQNLYHKHIMSFLAWWHNPQQKTLNFITELFLSGTLRSYRKKMRHINDNILKRWAMQILEGLVYLHGHVPPIVHRDLKCDNIFYNANQGIVKIGDLGLATCQQGLSVVGTPEFLAPEIYEEQYNEKVDIYSFGMCLLELATQQYPYSECQRVAQIFRKVTMGIKPAGLQQVTGELREMIELCIAHDPNQRPEARQLVKHPFFDSIRGLVGHGTEQRTSSAGASPTVPPSVPSRETLETSSAPPSITPSSATAKAATAAATAAAAAAAGGVQQGSLQRAATVCVGQVAAGAKQVLSHAIDVIEEDEGSDTENKGQARWRQESTSTSSITSSAPSGFDPRQRHYHSVNEAEVQLRHMREAQEESEGMEEGDDFDEAMSDSSEEVVVPIDCLASAMDDSDDDEDALGEVADGLGGDMATPHSGQARPTGLAQTLMLSMRATSRVMEHSPMKSIPPTSRLGNVSGMGTGEAASGSPVRSSPLATVAATAATASPPARSGPSRRTQAVLRISDLFAKAADSDQEARGATPASSSRNDLVTTGSGLMADEELMTSRVEQLSFQGPVRSKSHEPVAPGSRPICGVIVRIKRAHKGRALEHIASGNKREKEERSSLAVRTQSAPPGAPEFEKALAMLRK